MPRDAYTLPIVTHCAKQGSKYLQPTRRVNVVCDIKRADGSVMLKKAPHTQKTFFRIVILSQAFVTRGATPFAYN